MTENTNIERLLLSGNEAVARGALDAQVSLGTAYPGTPSTEILENFSLIGGRAQWAPNEKVALEVAIGAAFGGGRTLCTMKHVGVNVAADPLFTVAYTGVTGALVLVSADDPGMASSQNEQDNRRYAQAAGVPMLEPSDSQEAYDFTQRAIEISEKWQTPVILRMTTRICHSKTVVVPKPLVGPAPAPKWERDIPGRVMIPGYARPAHKKLRAKLHEMADWNDSADLSRVEEGDKSLGIITASISYVHSKEAAPEASFLKLGMSYPFPEKKIRDFVESVDRCVIVEEGDPWLVENIRAMGLNVEGKPEMYRFGELTVNRVKRILDGDTSEEAALPKGKPPQLCAGCPHRVAFQLLSDLDCIVTGDIGCYTLGVLPPFSAMDTCVCMGASIGVGLGLRHTLPPEEAKRVVSVIGDSTFVHSGITGLVEMVYNRPDTGHVVLILDNSTTAMTGMQEHPGTGRALNHEPAHQLDYVKLAESIGVEKVVTVDLAKERKGLEPALKEALSNGKLNLIIAQRPCILAAPKIKEYEARQTQA
ncbi:MAG: thiamine pyrophosphate-dependent enzyme [Candidatus Sumerlaeia bacterium]